MLDLSAIIQLIATVVLLIWLWQCVRWTKAQADINEGHDVMAVTQRDRIEELEARMKRIEDAIIDSVAKEFE